MTNTKLILAIIVGMLLGTGIFMMIVAFLDTNDCNESAFLAYANEQEYALYNITNHENGTITATRKDGLGTEVDVIVDNCEVNEVDPLTDLNPQRSCNVVAFLVHLNNTQDTDFNRVWWEGDDLHLLEWDAEGMWHLTFSECELQPGELEVAL